MPKITQAQVDIWKKSFSEAIRLMLKNWDVDIDEYSEQEKQESIQSQENCNKIADELERIFGYDPLWASDDENSVLAELIGYIDDPFDWQCDMRLTIEGWEQLINPLFDKLIDLNIVYSNTKHPGPPIYKLANGSYGSWEQKEKEL